MDNIKIIHVPCREVKSSAIRILTTFLFVVKIRFTDYFIKPGTVNDRLMIWALIKNSSITF